MSRPTLVLIDGHALAYRQFFALPAAGFMTKAGEPTNATFGFARTLLDILDERPNYLAVTFDQGLSGRGEMYSDYKGTREKMPDDLRAQLNRIREVVKAFNIPILELDGYEADDVLGSVAPQAEA
ncbi:MAG: DNA polymerase I, partial [Chloroflexi bacterium]|nr:DNA polymerase I [Chloroflexota bacterium]